MERVEKSKKYAALCILFLCMANIVMTTACAKNDTSITDSIQSERHEIEGLEWQEYEELEYAKGFAIEKYNDGFRLVTVSDGSQFLIVPEGYEAPESIKHSLRSGIVFGILW